jgi:hypothetical protein
MHSNPFMPFSNQDVRRVWSPFEKLCGWFEIFLEEMARLPISIKGGFGEKLGQQIRVRPCQRGMIKRRRLGDDPCFPSNPSFIISLLR